MCRLRLEEDLTVLDHLVEVEDDNIMRGRKLTPVS